MNGLIEDVFYRKVTKKVVADLHADYPCHFKMVIIIHAFINRPIMMYIFYYLMK